MQVENSTRYAKYCGFIPPVWLLLGYSLHVCVCVCVCVCVHTQYVNHQWLIYDILKMFDSRKTLFKSYGVMTLDIFCAQWIYASTAIYKTNGWS